LTKALFAPLFVIFSCCLIFLCACSIAFSASPEGKYCLEGRDTKIQFGEDCRYALLGGYEDKEIGHLTNLVGTLYDNKKNEPILSPIYTYQETKDSVFMVSKDEVVWYQKEHNKLVRRVNPEKLTATQNKIIKNLHKKAERTVQKAKQEASNSY